MAWVFGGKHFGEYTYEHWFDDEYEYEEVNTRKGAVMQKETITLFMNYNRSVNNAMNDIIKTLSTEEWEKPLGGFFPSVRGLCSHIYICDYNWLKRFRNIRPFIALNDAFFDSTYSFTETLFEDMGEYFAKRLELDSRMIAFADELTDTDIDSTINYTDSEGNAHKRNFGGCLLHFLNHETHHRGMISLYLEMLGRENDFCSLARVLS
jgi:uncharacterized damage-inducible protein DinB